jgi:hypothetical protein
MTPTDAEIIITIAAQAAVTFSKTSNCVDHSRTRWWRSGRSLRSLKPGAPEITTTGLFSAQAPAVELTTESPPTP